MTQQQCQQAMAAGAAALEQACQHMQQAATAAGCAGDSSPSECVICVGELGIGNTTAAAALLAALCGAAPEEVCGRGTGEGRGTHSTHRHTHTHTSAASHVQPLSAKSAHTGALGQ